jgi:hypothetical protein
MLTAEIDPNGNSSLAKGVVRVMYGNGNVHDRVRGPVILLQMYRAIEKKNEAGIYVKRQSGVILEGIAALPEDEYIISMKSDSLNVVRREPPLRYNFKYVRND